MPTTSAVLEQPVTVTSELSIDPVDVDRFLALVDAGFGTGGQFEGNLEFEVFVDEGERGRMLLVERWRSEQDQRNFIAWRRSTGDLANFERFLIAPPVTHRFAG